MFPLRIVARSSAALGLLGIGGPSAVTVGTTSYPAPGSVISTLTITPLSITASATACFSVTCKTIRLPKSVFTSPVVTNCGVIRKSSSVLNHRRFSSSAMTSNGSEAIETNL